MTRSYGKSPYTNRNVKRTCVQFIFRSYRLITGSFPGTSGDLPAQDKMQKKELSADLLERRVAE